MSQGWSTCNKKNRMKCICRNINLYNLVVWSSKCVLHCCEKVMVPCENFHFWSTQHLFSWTYCLFFSLNWEFIILSIFSLKLRRWASSCLCCTLYSNSSYELLLKFLVSYKLLCQCLSGVQLQVSILCFCFLFCCSW